MNKALLQQERSRASRRAIMNAADKLWARHAFDSISVEQVCLEAGVAKGSFYFYFPKKEHLLVMLVFSRFLPHENELEELLATGKTTAELCQMLGALVAERAAKMQRHMVRRGIEESFQHHARIAQLEGGNRRLSWFYRPIFERGLKRAEVAASWDLDVLCSMISWATLQALLVWSIGRGSAAELKASMRQRIELVSNGARTERQPSPRAPKRAAQRAPETQAAS